MVFTNTRDSLVSVGLSDLLWNLSASDCGLMIFRRASAVVSSIKAHANIIATSFDFADYAIFVVEFLSIITRPFLPKN